MTPFAKRPKAPRILLFISIGLYAIALSQDGFYAGGHAWGPGWYLLLLGFFGLFGLYLPWLANPMLFISWASFKSAKDSALGTKTALLAILFILSFLLYRTVLMNEAGHFGSITGYGLGYWLWLSSAITTLAAHILNTRHIKNA